VILSAELKTFLPKQSVSVILSLFRGRAKVTCQKYQKLAL